MNNIQQLAPSVVNKIAAGEVVERPASVVKELMENAVDAGAKRIDVALDRGGGDLVRVSDDGEGIPSDELPLAVASHATSKIRDAEDLFRVSTLGFRGEALASIAEVSALRLRSRRAGAEAGAELEVVGGKVGQVAPCGCPVGTLIEVRNLFFNTPVRRRFLRSEQTEMGHAAEAFTRIALAQPQVHFSLRHNDRPIHELPAVESWLERIASLCGPSLADGMLAVDSRDERVHLRGYVGNPSLSRANNRMQYLFLNGRYIRDRSLQHALSEAYRGLLLSGRFPVAFVRIELPADAVDVNVHPTKLEVRFEDGGRIYSHLLGAVRRKFLGSDLTAKVHTPTLDSPKPSSQDGPEGAGDRDPTGTWGSSGAAEPSGGAARASACRGWPEAAPSGNEPAGGLRFAPPPATPSWPAPPLRDQVAAEIVDRPQHAHALSSGGPAAGLQLHNRYLVTENAEGMVVIDQHALHERILYERLRRQVLGGGVETQRLLVPEPVTLAPAEAAAALEGRETLAQLGITVEPFGGNTVLVSGYPAMLANFSPSETLRQVVEQLLAGGKAAERRDLLDRLLHTIACKAAVKAGDRLSAEEVAALLQQRHLCQDAHHCPHGRPTSLVFTKEELDKRFQRI